MTNEHPTAEDASGLAGQLTAHDPAVGLNAVWALRTLLDQVERAQVDNARSQQWSWQDIARALRVSRQTVHEKHAPRRRTMGLEA
jgi:hypothetical protein